MSETQTLTAARTPTVYFIDDSATMREVIKIAFRKENIQVITCADASSALAQFGEAVPDAVITDVIMPDKDGYEVCQFVRQHERLHKIPVILMSGIVNQTVAEKAMKVKADELIRKPFQPQDLIARVKGLIGARFPSLAASPDAATSQASSQPRPSPQALSSFFSGGAPSPTVPPVPVARMEKPVATIPVKPAQPTVQPPAQSHVQSPAGSTPASPPPARIPAASAPASVTPTAASTASSVPSQSQSTDVQKLRNEILRLELLVKRLQAELSAGREYCTALEAHFKRLQETD